VNAVIGIVGCGNLGEAIARGLIESGVPASQIVASHPRADRREQLTAGLKVRAVADNSEAVRVADVVLLGVKPQILPSVLPGIADAARGKLVVSLAAGTPLASIAAALPGARIVRAMPNTPAAVRAGATGLFAGEGVRDDDRARVSSVFDAMGISVWVPREDLFHAVTGLSACGPAFVFAVGEALADGGVAAGLPRALAASLAAATIAGAGKMLQTGQHPGALKDQVASAGGTTIHGLAALEQSGVRGGVIAAVIAAAERSREMAESRPAPSAKAVARGRAGARRAKPRSRRTAPKRRRS